MDTDRWAHRPKILEHRTFQQQNREERTGGQSLLGIALHSFLLYETGVSLDHSYLTSTAGMTILSHSLRASAARADSLQQGNRWTIGYPIIASEVWQKEKLDLSGQRSRENLLDRLETFFQSKRFSPKATKATLPLWL